VALALDKNVEIGLFLKLKLLMSIEPRAGLLDKRHGRLSAPRPTDGPRKDRRDERTALTEETL